MSLALLLALAAAPPADAAAWWRHVEVLAADDMEGRETGAPGYRRAADYVVAQLTALGLEPAGSDGFLQPLMFETQRIAPERSTARLVSTGGTATPLVVGRDLLVSAGAPRLQRVAAPLVFVGYGLHIPEAGHDDFAGVDLKGKIAVFIGGGPQAISGALKSHARAERAKLLDGMGAVGAIALETPRMEEIPWSRRIPLAQVKGMYLADATLRDVSRPMLGAALDPARSAALFAGSGRSFDEIVALADASQPIPGFALSQTLEADIAIERGRAEAPNIVARLPGRDPRLKAETVVLSAHLDHLGMAPPGSADRVFNGAMDNASGVASLLEIARQLAAGDRRPKRSILFLIVCGEEKGLLGSRAFARRPTVPAASIVADINLDMPLPLWPLTSVLMLGAEQSSLGADARAVGAAMGIAVAPDPLPDRNSFTRSDQYAFIEQGVPALFPKFGFARGTPAFEIERQFRSTRYHALSDDLAQPVNKDDAVRFNALLAALVRRVADAPARPSWNRDSFFRRFAVGNRASSPRVQPPSSQGDNR